MVGPGTVHLPKSTESLEFILRSKIGYANSTANMATLYLQTLICTRKNPNHY